MNALRAFAMVYSTGGIRAAARELAVAHSAVSRHLRELDVWLGVTLTRQAGGRRGLVFTPQGEILGKAVLSGLEGIEKTVTSLREARSANSVIISTTSSFAARWLLPRLPAFEAAHRKIEVSVIVEQGLSDLDSSNIDFAIRMGSGPWSDLHCEPLMDDALYPVMKPAFWERARRPDKPAQLVRQRLLHDRDSQASWAAWKKAFGPDSLDVRKGPRYSSSDLLLRAAAQGQGVALARHQLVREDIATNLLLRPMGSLSLELGPSYWIVSSPRTPLRPAAETVRAWLMNEEGANGISS